MKKPTIGLVHYTYPPVIGGVEKIVFDHTQLFEKYGYETHIFAGEGKNNNRKIHLEIIPEFRSLGITNQILRDQILTQSAFPPDFFQQADKIYKKIETVFAPIDIFFIHNVLTLTFNPCLNQALITYIRNHKEKKYVIWVHDVILDSIRKKRTFKNSQVEKLFYQPIPDTRYVGISHFLKKTLVEEIGFPQNGVTVIPNGVDINTVLNLHPTTEKIISKYDLLKFDPVLLLPTKIMRQKNIDLCLDITNQIKKLGKNPLLIITAMNFPHNKDFSYVQEILNLINRFEIKKNVILLHNEVEDNYRDMEYKIVDDFYRLSDVVLFLSSFENFGLPLLESGITKTPILVNNLEVFKEIEAKNIYYADIENENAEELVKKVLKIIEENPQISFFRKLKKEYNFDHIFQTKIIPLIDEIWKK